MLLKTTRSRPAGAFIDFFTEAFLPHGYPASVSPDYMLYQVYDTAQAFCSSIVGMLSTQAVLRGVGVGDDNATALSATLAYLVRDGTGMLGRILFAWLKGSDLDNNAKQWRLVADVLNDGAMLVELLAPSYPTLFVPLISLASVGKAVVGVAGGATRAALTQHQARANNTGDVSAKDGSQETLVNLIALLVGFLVLPYVADNAVATWGLFSIFTMLHLLCNYSAVRSLQLNQFNVRRVRPLFAHSILSSAFFI